jgi:drug/metabolite transporter (DMT)-like permease
VKALLKSRKVQGYLFAMGAALAYGVSQIIAKRIVGEVPPLVGSAFGLLFGALILGVLSAPSMARGGRAPARAYGWAALAGLASSSGVIFMFLAMSKAPVVVVSPILAVNPLIAIVLGQLLIRRMERLSWRVVLGAVIVVAGVATIAIGRNV